MYYNKAFKMVETYQPVNQFRLRVIITGNRILCSYRLKKYQKMHKLIKDFNRISPQKNDDYYTVVLLKGMKYRDTYDFEKAMQAYDEILNNELDIESKTVLLTYENYAELYQMKFEYEKSLRYISRSYQYQTRLDLHYIPNLYLNEAKSYFELGQAEKALELLQEGIVLAAKVSRIELFVQLSLYRTLINYRRGAYQVAEEQLKDLEKKLIQQKRDDLLGLVYLSLVQLYCKWNKRDSCLSYTTKMISASNKK